MDQLNAATVALLAFNEEFEAGLQALRRGKVAEALITFKTLRDAYEKLDEPRKALNAMIEGLSRSTIPEMMEEESTKTITLEDPRIGKYRFTVSQRVSCSMLDKDAGFEWLRETGNGGIIVPTVNAQTLGAFAKDYMAQGKDLPDTIFKISLMNTTSVTKG